MFGTNGELLKPAAKPKRNFPDQQTLTMPFVLKDKIIKVKRNRHSLPMVNRDTLRTPTLSARSGVKSIRKDDTQEAIEVAQDESETKSESDKSLKPKVSVVDNKNLV